MRTQREDALAFLIAIARDNSKCESQKDNSERIDAAAQLLRPSVSHRDCIGVAEVLAHTADDRARDALREWALRGRSRGDAIWAMQRYPSASYLPVADAILATPSDARGLDLRPFGLYKYERFFQHGTPWRASFHAAALGILAAIATPEALARLREVAVDRGIPTPDPVTLQALRCTRAPGFDGVHTFEDAQAAASPRLFALMLLDDKGVMRAIADDRREVPLLRRWARKLAEMPPPEPCGSFDGHTICGPIKPYAGETPDPPPCK